MSLSDWQACLLSHDHERAELADFARACDAAPRRVSHLMIIYELARRRSGRASAYEGVACAALGAMLTPMRRHAGR